MMHTCGLEFESPSCKKVVMATYVIVIPCYGVQRLEDCWGLLSSSLALGTMKDLVSRDLGDALETNPSYIMSSKPDRNMWQDPI